LSDLDYVFARTIRVEKEPKELRALPKAVTLRPGTYKIITGPGETVTVRHSIKKSGDGDNLSDTDWMLLLVDAGWEKAEFAYYQGLEEGFTSGLEKGLEQGRSEAQRAALSFRESLQTLETNLIKFFAGLERWTVKLAMNIAEKVIAQTASEKKDLIEQIVRKAIAETADKSKILIRVNPADYEALKEFKNNVSAIAEGIDHFRLETDGSITPGSCRVETPSGLLDADFTTQIGELRRALIFQEEARG
jgi:flagellar biosynthesis/type III secretory pathway protein FliH